MNSIYINIFYIALVLGITFLFLSIALFFGFNIPKIIGNLSGRTAQIDIKKIREKNETSGVKKYKSSVVNENRGKKTDKIVSGRLVKNLKINYGELRTDELEHKNGNNKASTATTVLDSEEIKTNNLNVTTVLDNFRDTIENHNETTVLGTSEVTYKSDNSFEVEEDIYFAESAEIIT